MKTVFLDRATLGYDLDITLPFNTETVVYDNIESDRLLSAISDADVIFVNKIKLTADVLKFAPKLKLILEAATGYDNIDIEYCKKNKIAVCNVPAYSINSVSQLAVAMVMYLANHIPEYVNYIKSGEYTKSNVANKLTPIVHELSGLTWGIVGYGNIGKKTADVARAFGCKILAYKKKPIEEVECVDIDTLLEKSDIITVHLPLNEQTENLINAERIAKMKHSAIFVNVARGKIVDEIALCKAVKDKKIGGIGIDVYSVEPFGEDSPYYEIKEMDNVCLTPHMGWGAYEARKRCFDIMIENMKAFFDGEIKNRVEI